MSANIYLNLLFLCGVLCQGIIGTVSENDIGGSTDLLVRQKRVISRVEDEDVRQSVKNFPFIVVVRETRTENHCPGTILRKNLVITIAKCVQLPIDKYQVFSATSRTAYSRRTNIHNIIEKRIYHGVHPFRTGDGVALVVVHPPILSETTAPIELYQGNLHPGQQVRVLGWGCDETGRFHTRHADYLRSITVPIISEQHCADLYRRIFAISEADICTLDPHELRYCTEKDAGAPLIVDVNGKHYLAGLHLWNGGVLGQQNPDVFINLQERFYKPWLVHNIHSLSFLHP